MTRNEFVKKLAKHWGCGVRPAKNIVSDVFDVLMDAIAEEEKVSITGFGTFKKKEIAARDYKGFWGDEVVRSKPSVKVRFDPGRTLSSLVTERYAPEE